MTGRAFDEDEAIAIDDEILSCRTLAELGHLGSTLAERVAHWPAAEVAITRTVYSVHRYQLSRGTEWVISSHFQG